MQYPGFYNYIHGTRILMDMRYRRSLLIQGGLEIPVQVTVEMKLPWRSYKALIEGYYQEPVDGTFPDATASTYFRRMTTISVWMTMISTPKM